MSDSGQLRIPIFRTNAAGREVFNSLIHTVELHDTIDELQTRIISNSNGRINDFEILQSKA